MGGVLIHNRTGMRIGSCKECGMTSLPVDERDICIGCFKKPDAVINIDEIVEGYKEYCVCTLEHHFLYEDKNYLICKKEDIDHKYNENGIISSVNYEKCIKEESHCLGMAFYCIEEAKKKIDLIHELGKEEAEKVNIVKYIKNDCSLQEPKYLGEGTCSVYKKKNVTIYLENPIRCIKCADPDTFNKPSKYNQINPVLNTFRNLQHFLTGRVYI